MNALVEDILSFWENVGPKGWYAISDSLDEEIRQKYLSLWQETYDGGHKDWQTSAEGALAQIILLDQFPRNMFRGDANSFATDKQALCLAKKSIRRNFDQEIDGPMRQFFYMPFMHSESPVDQDTAVRAFINRMPGTNNLLHAQAHRAVIRDFGRFPYRNEALDRENTPAEVEYLKAGGYSATLERLSA